LWGLQPAMATARGPTATLLFNLAADDDDEDAETML
jgi:hypothetical protein